jgi:hypothetical protein
MKLELDLPETVLRKIRAYQALSGVHSTTIEGVLVGLLDDVVSLRCAELLGLTAVEVAAPRPPAPRRTQARADDVTGLSAGLGDADPGDDDGDVIPPTAAEDFIPTQGGLTEDMLEHDLDVDDPDHEAAADAPAARGGRAPEDAFASAVGYTEARQDFGGLDGIRVRNRKQLPKRRGRVVPLTHEPAN